MPVAVVKHHSCLWIVYGRAVLVQNLGLFRDLQGRADGSHESSVCSFNDIGDEDHANRTQNRAPQTATHQARAHASGQLERAVGCRCKDSKNPQEHGPYYQLSFTWRGKGPTRFVRTEHLAEVRQKLANYKRFRELTDDWVDLVVDGAARTGEKPVGRWKSILRTYRRK